MKNKFKIERKINFKFLLFISTQIFINIITWTACILSVFYFFKLTQLSVYEYGFLLAPAIKVSLALLAINLYIYSKYFRQKVLLSIEKFDDMYELKFYNGKSQTKVYRKNQRLSEVLEITKEKHYLGFVSVGVSVFFSEMLKGEVDRLDKENNYPELEKFDKFVNYAHLGFIPDEDATLLENFLKEEVNK